LYTWTVDLDPSDMGGRAPCMSRTIKGLDIILETFKQYNVKALFFVSTEMLGTGFDEGYDHLVLKIMEHGHEIGSHGHFHIKYTGKCRNLREMNDEYMSRRLLVKLTGELYPEYRAPWFRHRTSSVYSDPKNHVSVLKHSWFKKQIPLKPIFYVHPSDIAGIDNPRFKSEKAPNLFCKILYSRPNHVLDTFKRLVRLYPYSPKETAS